MFLRLFYFLISFASKGGGKEIQTSDCFISCDPQSIVLIHDQFDFF